MSNNENWTPGPWYYNGQLGTDYAVISTVLGSYNYDHEVLGTSEWVRVNNEDAHLIAAAPELYEALEEALDEMWYEARHNDEHPSIIKARAALAKSRGEDHE